MNAAANDISCYSSQLLIRHARAHGVPDERIFDGITVEPKVLENAMEWTDVQTWSQLASNVAEALAAGPEGVQKVAEEITLHDIGSFQLAFLKLIPLNDLVRRVGRHVRTSINRNLAVRIETLRPGEAELCICPVVPSRYSQQVCDYNRGTVTALLRLKGYRDIRIEETACCLHEGANECRYRIRWNPRGGLLRRVRTELLYRLSGQRAALVALEERYYGLRAQYDDMVRVEAALRRSEGRFRAIFENIVDVYFEATQDGRVIEVSPSVEALTGLSRSTVYGMYLGTLLAAPSEWEGMLSALRRDGRVSDYEVVVRRGDGAERFCSVTAAMISDSEGKPYKLAGTIRDISSRKQAEAAVRESEQRFRQLADNINEVFWLCSPDITEVYVVNPAFEKVWGVPRERLLRDPSLMLAAVEPGDKAAAERLLHGMRAAAPGSANAAEFRIRRPDGSVRWVSCRLYAVRDADGRVFRVAGIATDITDTRTAAEERRAMEEQLFQAQKMDAIGQLAGGIAHDFNNQLAGIMGFAELLRDEVGTDSKLASYVDYILLGSRRAAELTAKLLAFARKGKYQSVPVNIHKVIAETVSLLEHTVDKRVRIVQVLSASPAETMGDPSQLQNAILNLGLNARDAMPEGGELTFATESVTLDERACRSLPFDLVPGAYVRVKVSDTGVGMDDDVQRRIFEPFFTTKSEGKGTGMGLPSVYGTVRNHHGAVTFESRLGKGTTFTVLLPVMPGAGGEGATAASAAQRAARGGATVLVVDDEETFRDMAVATLTSLGYRAVTCPDGIAAVEYFRHASSSVDLVMLDMVMPGMDGKETFARMREIDPHARVLLCSGYSVDGRAQELLGKGAAGFIEKPFRKAELAEKLAEVLGGAAEKGQGRTH